MSPVLACEPVCQPEGLLTSAEIAVEANDAMIRIFASHPALAETDVRAASQWWQNERRGEEGLPEFLVRQQVFLPEAIRAIDMLRKGIITYCDPKRIFSEQGPARLRECALRLGLVDAGVAQPGARLNEVKAWLAKRNESRQGGSGASSDSTGSSMYKVPALPKVEPRAPTSGPGSSQFHRSGVTPGRMPTPAPPPSTPPIKRDPRPSGTLQRRFTPEPGAEIGKFFLVEQIGQGGTAVVFRALHRVLNIPVALKFLKFDQSDVFSGDNDDQVFQQLRKEAQLLARFNHPNIVRIFDFEETCDLPFLVMEFVDGLSLSEMISFCGRLRPDRAAKILIQIADGLASAQKKIGLVHRDVKPGNILMSREGSVKLADLGLALTNTFNNPHSAETSTILAGTMAYMSPEQAQASPSVDHRSDIYSLGATFYHALTGEMPFRGKTRVELMYKHAKEPVNPPHLVVPGLDPLYSEIVLKMLAKDPKERYQSYEDLLSSLATLQAKSDSMIAMPSSTSHPVATTPV